MSTGRSPADAKRLQQPAQLRLLNQVVDDRTPRAGLEAARQLAGQIPARKQAGGHERQHAMRFGAVGERLRIDRGDGHDRLGRAAQNRSQMLGQVL